jgi:hypothetical protein
MKRKNKTSKIKRAPLTDEEFLDGGCINSIINNDYRLSRWASLAEAVNLIYEHSLDRNKKFNELDLKPLAIQKYVENKSDEILQRINREKEKQSQ